ncbi:MAG: oligosaccharide flippase family protein [Lachnospiraceae bacterium]|nr:oligosaccharide flippase family protein [Lachnospiraceae bacterium]
MKKNNYLKHFATIGVGTFLNMLLGVFTTPIITRMVDPNEYGQFSLFTTYSGIMVMIMCIGLDQTLVRYYYEHDSVDYKRFLLSKCIFLPVIVCLIVSGIMIALTSLNIITLEFSSTVVIELCIYSFFQLIFRFSQLVVRLEYKSRLYSALSIISKIVYVIVAVGLLMYVKGNNLNILIIAIIAAAIVPVIISIIAQSDFWNFRKIKKNQEYRLPMKELLKYGYPFIFSMGVMTMFQAVDKISLQSMRSYAEVGIYASTNTLVGIFAIVQTSFNALWTPLAVEHYAKDPNDVSFYQKGNRIITLLMFCMGLTLILCKDVFALLLGEKYRQAAYILPMLIFNPIMYTVSETTVGGIVFMKKSGAHIIITLVSCITNIIGNIILVPKLGCQGAAISTGVSYIVFFTMRTLIANRYFYIDFKLGSFYFVTFLSVLYALYNSFNSFNIFTVVGYLVCIVFVMILYWSDVKWCLDYAKKSIDDLRLKQK